VENLLLVLPEPKTKNHQPPRRWTAIVFHGWVFPPPCHALGAEKGGRAQYLPNPSTRKGEKGA